MDIDTLGTFNVSHVLYKKFFRVSILLAGASPLLVFCSLTPPSHPVLQDHGGVIVNITATLGNRGQVLQVHAGSAKAAVGTAPHLVCSPGFLRVPLQLIPGGQQCPSGQWRGPALDLSPHFHLGCPRRQSNPAFSLMPVFLPCRCNDAALGCRVGSPEHPSQQPCPWPHQWHRGAPAASR